MDSNNYVVIQGWMCNELDLKGNELLTFALIYGFSQDGQSRFYGSRNYIADTFNISLPTVDKAIETLRSKNLIVRYVITDEKGVHYEYEVCKETLQGVVKKLYMGSKETLHNNTSNTTKKEKVVSKDTTTEFQFGKQKPKKDNLYTKCINLVDEFVSNHNCGNPVRSRLINYLNYRLSVKDKPLYFNMWKGMLNKLDDLHKQGYGYAPIIDYCLERGYLSFYPPMSYNSIKSESGSKTVPYMTEKDYEEEAKRLAELEAKGIQVRF